MAVTVTGPSIDSIRGDQLHRRTPLSSSIDDNGHPPDFQHDYFSVYQQSERERGEGVLVKSS